jgi:hypothetical protein
MSLAEKTYRVTSKLTTALSFLPLPLATKITKAQKSVDDSIYKYLTWRSGEPTAKRNAHHPLHRYDVAILNSDGTLLAAHGALTKETGTPLLRWSDNGYWALVLTGAKHSIATAQWDDRAAIDSLVERLDGPFEASPVVEEPTRVAPVDPIDLAPVHTFARTLEDLHEATGAPQEPWGGIAQLVRHTPSNKPVAVLLTLPDNLLKTQNFLISAMGTRGWNLVPLSDEPNTICLTLAPVKAWVALSPAIESPEGDRNGHRRW